jgi:hypothetical protein
VFHDVHVRRMIVQAPCMLRCTGAARALHRRPPPSLPARHRCARPARQRVMRTTAWSPLGGTPTPMIESSSRRALAEAAAGGAFPFVPKNPLDAMLHVAAGQVKQLAALVNSHMMTTWAFSDIW